MEDKQKLHSFQRGYKTCMKVARSAYGLHKSKHFPVVWNKK